jgi:hypothetical protein
VERGDVGLEDVDFVDHGALTIASLDACFPLRV